MYEKLKERFTSGVFKGEKTKERAFEKAYADMSRRATGHKASMKTACMQWLEENRVFEKVLTCTTQEDFDRWHREACEKLKEIHGNFGRIGRSQKVINMAFKYLSCIDNTYDSVLPFCHMTLDGYTLNWYKEIGGEWVEWSKIDDYDEYFNIQEDIRNHLQNNTEYSITINKKATKTIPLSNLPFKAEFIVWEGEIIKSKYNNIIKDLVNYKNKGKEKDKWLIDDMFDCYLQDYSKLLICDKKK